METMTVSVTDSFDGSKFFEVIPLFCIVSYHL